MAHSGVSIQAGQGGKGADWKNYKRSLVQRGELRTLMQDAHGGLIR